MTAVHISGESRQSFVPVLKYSDELNDVAVLKIAGRGFDFFALPIHSPQIGERVFAIGNPRGLEELFLGGNHVWQSRDGRHLMDSTFSANFSGK